MPRHFPMLAAALALLPALAACSSWTIAQKNQGYGVAAAAVASVIPSADLEQTYYLGSFDPRGQLPPTIYRIRVRGQSSILNQTRFASGWVPAAVVDSLARSLTIDTKTGAVGVGGEGATSVISDKGRRLVLFGPEGFREAPRDHRLVVMMGSSPEEVEQAFASAIGAVALAKFGQSGPALDRELFGLLLELGHEREQLQALAEDK